MKISAVIITYNEEKNTEECLESVKFLDEIVIIDSCSTDKTTEIAKTFTNKIFLSEVNNVTENRKLAFNMASNDWLLFLDADERISPELKEELIALKNSAPNEIAGYFINRKNYYFGKLVKHCGIYPDYHIRLFDKTKSVVTERIIHEGVEVSGQNARLEHNILHYPVRDFEQMISKINYYSTLEALEHFQNGKKISKFGVFTHALSAFLRVYISRKGFLDGWSGFLVSFNEFMVNILTHLKLLKMQGYL